MKPQQFYYNLSVKGTLNEEAGLRFFFIGLTFSVKLSVYIVYFPYMSLDV